MTSRSLFVLAALLSAIGMGGGCTAGPDGTSELQPLVFPWEGQLGSTGLGTTVAIVIDSNYIDYGDNLELYDLHRSRVSVTVADPLAVFPAASAPVRSVFSLQATPNSNRHNARPGSWVTVVVVDLPSATALGSPSSFPFTALLRVSIDGQPDLEPRFIITGNQGVPNPLVDSAFASAAEANAALEPRPTLRLRGKRTPGIFQPGQPALAGIQFRLAYLNACVASIRAYPGTEAANATAHVGPVLGSAYGYSAVNVVLVDPTGFNLSYMTDGPLADTTDETLAGNGPLLDIAVNWMATTNSACALTNPQLVLFSDLRVSDREGNAVFSVPGPFTIDSADSPSPTAVFRSYAVDLPPPPPTGGGC